MLGAQKPVTEALVPLKQACLRFLATVLTRLVSILAIRRTPQPLTRLRQATQAWGGPDFQRQLAAVAGGDEIGDLARDFQEMGARLGQILATLEAAGRQWERTFDLAPDAVFLLNGDFRIRRLKRATARLVGENGCL